ncbi:MAG: hypothetical protein ACRCU1_02805, partial [Alsobacter sp.]
MPNLTPELLAQLERDAAGFGGRFEARIGDCSDSVYYIGLDGENHEIIADCEIDDVVEPLARMLDSVGPLVAAAKERDQLRAEVERLRGLGLGLEAVGLIEHDEEEHGVSPEICGDDVVVIVAASATTARAAVRAAIKEATPLHVASRVIFAVEVPDELGHQPPPANPPRGEPVWPLVIDEA